MTETLWRRLLPLATIAVVSALGVSACQPGSYRPPSPSQAESADRPALADIDWLESPKDYVGPSTAVLTRQEVVPITPTAPTPSLPVTITSDDLAGPKEVTVTRADRIIAVDMAGSLAQTVWGLGLGDRLVGRDI